MFEAKSFSEKEVKSNTQFQSHKEKPINSKIRSLLSSTAIFSVLAIGFMMAGGQSANSMNVVPSTPPANSSETLYTYYDTDKTTLIKVIRLNDGSVKTTRTRKNVTLDYSTSVYSSDYSSRSVQVKFPDGSTGFVTQKPIRRTISWDGDNKTRKIVYRYADNVEMVASKVFEPKQTVHYTGATKFITTTYANGTVIVKTYKPNYVNGAISSVNQSVRQRVRGGEFVQISSTTVNANSTLAGEFNTSIVYSAQFQDGTGYDFTKKNADSYNFGLTNSGLNTYTMTRSIKGNESDTALASSVNAKIAGGSRNVKLSFSFLDGLSKTEDIAFSKQVKTISESWDSDDRSVKSILISFKDGTSETRKYKLSDVKISKLQAVSASNIRGSSNYQVTLQNSDIVCYADGSLKSRTVQSTKQATLIMDSVKMNASRDEITATYKFSDNSTVELKSKVVYISKGQYIANGMRNFSGTISADGKSRTFPVWIKLIHDNGLSMPILANFRMTEFAQNIDAPDTNWVSSDLVVKTYRFDDGVTRDVVEKINPTLRKFEYSGSEKRIFYKHGNGDIDTASTAEWIIGQPTGEERWSEDKRARGQVYQFSDGSQNIIWEYIDPTLSQPIYSAANYSAAWDPTSWSSVTPVSQQSVTAPVTTSATVEIDGVRVVSEDGSDIKPFKQSTLALAGITDPNAHVSSVSGIQYDLRWGEPDFNGPGYVQNIKSNLSGFMTLPAQTIFKQNIYGGSDTTCLTSKACDINLKAPSDDVLNAWKQGWTGKNVNVLIMDALGDYQTTSHSARVALTAMRQAPGATYYGLEGLNFNDQGPVKNLDGTIATPSSTVKLGVVNLSVGLLNSSFGGFGPASYTIYELMRLRATHAHTMDAVIAKYSNPNYQNGFDFTNAVIVKSAGNESVDAQYDAANYYLTRNDDMYSRILIAGAVNKADDAISGADLASYSNFAGTDSKVNSRFILASGEFSSNKNGIEVDGVATSLPASEGTSFAAPRISGYAAIIRQKYPNLNASKTADILLSTATYRGLACNDQPGGCDRTKYGVGLADLGHALAPVGRLR